jgi:putative transposase
LGEIAISIAGDQLKGLNNRAENSHQPARRRERIMKRFTSARQAQWFLSIHAQVASLFHILCPESAAAFARHAVRTRAFTAWEDVSKARPAA